MLWRRKSAETRPLTTESVYDRLQRAQSVLWEGDPITVGFDYQPYLKEPARRRVNLRALLESERGELSLVGYCHDSQDERTFKLTSICGDVLVEKLERALSAGEFAQALRNGGL